MHTVFYYYRSHSVSKLASWPARENDGRKYTKLKIAEMFHLYFICSMVVVPCCLFSFAFNMQLTNKFSLLRLTHQDTNTHILPTN